MSNWALFNVRGRERALTVTVAAVFVAVLAWISAADRIVVSSGHDAGHFGGDADAQAALDALSRNASQMAQNKAQRAVRTAPVEPSATSALGSVSLVLGRTDQAYAAFTVAGALGWRDIHTQLFWLTQGLAGGDQAVVMQRLDALLRLDTDDDSVANTLLLLEKTQLGQMALATLLTQNPRWENRILIHTGTLKGADLAARLAAIDLAAKKGATFDCAAAGTAASQLIRDDEALSARDLWRQTCDRDGDLYLSDGSFEFDPANLSANPFNWQLQRSGGLDVDVARGPLPLHGHALRIASSQTVRAVAARQLTALRPGRYRLSWSTAVDAGKPDGSITVLVQCNGSKELPMTAGSAPGKGEASNAAVGFTVPATGCPIQTVKVEKAASSPGETRTGWIDDIRIMPLTSDAATTGE